MNSRAIEQGNWRERSAAACERLVHPAVTDRGDRQRQGRLIGLLLAAPFPAGVLIAQLLHGTSAGGYMLAAVCMVFALSWLGAVAIALSAKTALVEAGAIGLWSIGIGAAVAAGGLLHSPLLLLLFVPPFERWWVHRSREAAISGWWLSAGAFALAAGAIVLGWAQRPEFSQHLWVIPLVYAASVWFRVTASQADPGAGSVEIHEELARLTGAVVAVVNEQGHVERVSGPCDALLGIRPAVLADTGLFDRMHVTDRVLYLQALGQAREGGGRSELELRMRTAGMASGGRDGEYRPIRFTIVANPSAGDGLLVMLSGREEIEAMRRELADARSKADSIEIAKGRFLASVSHELRTPLNAIIGFADMLDNEMFGPFADPRQKEYVHLIGESGQHLLSVVNAILDVSKIESGHYAIEPEPFRFADALDMCFSMMLLQARAKNVELLRVVDPSVGEISADRRAVQQILINLVANAVKFTPAGGSIEVKAEVAGPRLVFKVSDNGIGMSREDLERIGQPFMQVSNAYTRQYDGTGLGLSLVKGLVALHEGDMTIDSAPDLGTVVTISLPLAGPRTVAPMADAVAEIEIEEMEPEHEAGRRFA